jgi:hypothetical protein
MDRLWGSNSWLTLELAPRRRLNHLVYRLDNAMDHLDQCRATAIGVHSGAGGPIPAELVIG